MAQTHRGSCHCKAVAFEAPLDLATGTVRCNCSYCAKTRWWGVRTADLAAFQITKGEDAITKYRFAPERPVFHAFCKHCGVKLYSYGNVPQIGEFLSVSIAALDDLTPAQLDALDIRYCNGRDNAWQQQPEHHEYL